MISPTRLLAAAVGLSAAALAVVAVGLQRSRRRGGSATGERIAVVVAARNEAARIGPLLDALTAQSRPADEIVLIDDRSTDGTGALVQRYADRLPLTVVRIDSEPVGIGPKKRALAVGIGQTKSPWLVLTDADTRPGPDWLAGLSRLMAPEVGLIVGYGPYRRRGGWLNRFIRFETTRAALLTASAVGWNRPYMAVGRNLAYRRTLYDEVGGFASGAHALSGDDDLFVQQLARTRWRSVYAGQPETWAPSEAPRTVPDWIAQKRRHLSAGRAYEPWALVGLALWHGTQLAPPVVAGIALGRGASAKTVAALLGLHLALNAALFGDAARRFGERDLLPFYPALEPLYTAYLTLGSAAVSRPPTRWSA